MPAPPTLRCHAPSVGCPGQAGQGGDQHPLGCWPPPQLWMACLRHEPSLNELPGRWRGSVFLEAWLLGTAELPGERLALPDPSMIVTGFPRVAFCCLLLGVSLISIISAGRRTSTWSWRRRSDLQDKQLYCESKMSPRLPDPPACVCKQKRNFSHSPEIKSKAKI